MEIGLLLVLTRYDGSLHRGGSDVDWDVDSSLAGTQNVLLIVDIFLLVSSSRVKAERGYTHYNVHLSLPAGETAASSEPHTLQIEFSFSRGKFGIK